MNNNYLIEKGIKLADAIDTQAEKQSCLGQRASLGQVRLSGLWQVQGTRTTGQGGAWEEELGKRSEFGNAREESGFENKADSRTIQIRCRDVKPDANPLVLSTFLVFCF